jgi:hypothetical protein
MTKFAFDMDSNTSLKDAIAYEYFITHLDDVMNPEKSGEDTVKNVQILVDAAYLLAEIFCEGRDLHNKAVKETDAEQAEAA